ncbi:hypothetical protein BJ508DRAFT_316411, partial [Ascobolus immersus RN42]
EDYGVDPEHSDLQPRHSHALTQSRRHEEKSHDRYHEHVNHRPRESIITDKQTDNGRAGVKSKIHERDRVQARGGRSGDRNNYITDDTRTRHTNHGRSTGHDHDHEAEHDKLKSRQVRQRSHGAPHERRFDGERHRGRSRQREVDNYSSNTGRSNGHGGRNKGSANEQSRERQGRERQRQRSPSPRGHVERRIDTGRRGSHARDKPRDGGNMNNISRENEAARDKNNTTSRPVGGHRDSRRSRDRGQSREVRYRSRSRGRQGHRGDHRQTDNHPSGRSRSRHRQAQTGHYEQDSQRRHAENERSPDRGRRRRTPSPVRLGMPSIDRYPGYLKDYAPELECDVDWNDEMDVRRWNARRNAMRKKLGEPRFLKQPPAGLNVGVSVEIPAKYKGNGLRNMMSVMKVDNDSAIKELKREIRTVFRYKYQYIFRKSWKNMSET